MTKWREALLALYIVSGVAAFGHSAASSASACMATDLPCQKGQAAIGGLFAAFFSPLYWSWEAFDG